jgi:hypothetical protein
MPPAENAHGLDVDCDSPWELNFVFVCIYVLESKRKKEIR